MSYHIRKLGLLFILLDNMYMPGRYQFDFRLHYALYFLFISYYVIAYRTIRLKPLNLLYLIGIVLAFSLVPLIKGSGYEEFMKQTVLIAFNLIFSFLLLNAYKFDTQRVFKDYIDWIYLAAIVGVIQIVSQIVGFKYGADYSYLGFDMQHFNMQHWVIQSWFQEPSFLAIAFIPVTFVGVARLFKLTDLITFQQAIVIIAVLILSQSAVGLTGLLLALALVIMTKYSILKSPGLIIVSLTLFIVISFAFYSIPPVKIRVNDTVKLFVDTKVSADDIEGVNLSTYSMFSNFRVSKAILFDNPVFGSGLGTYELNYFKYIRKVLPPNSITANYALNERDANSMFLRISAELGLVGLLILGWFLVKNRVRVNLKNCNQLQINYWVINSAVLVLFFVRLLRQGHYTMLGFLLFVLIYVYSKRQFEVQPIDLTH